MYFERWFTMAIGKKRVLTLAAKRQRKELEMKAGGESKYARKKAWLATHPEYTFGFNVPSPKPWAGR
jgi:hypothetical protein